MRYLGIIAELGVGAAVGLVLLVVIAVVGRAIEGVRVNKGMRKYVERGDGIGVWREQFASASISEIEEYLKLFGDAFALERSWTAALQPGDRVVEIYRVLYPRKGEPDVFEFERFCEGMRKRHGFELGGVWKGEGWREDVTLGEVYGWARGGAVQQVRIQGNEATPK